MITFILCSVDVGFVLVLKRACFDNLGIFVLKILLVSSVTTFNCLDEKQIMKTYFNLS